MAEHVKSTDMSVTAHTKTHKYVILYIYIFTIIMRRKIKQNDVHMLCHRLYYALLDCVCDNWAGYLSCFNLECAMFLIYKCV